MSLPGQTVACTGCDYAAPFGNIPIWLVYRIPGNHYLKTGRRIGWCAKCNTVRDIEPNFRQYPAKDELRRLNDQIDSPFFQIGRWLRKFVGARRNPIVNRAAELEREIWLAKARKCDPRCLTCGSEQTVPLELDDRGVCTTFIHSCGGRLRQMPERDDGISFSLSAEVIYLDPQGRRVSGEGLNIPDLS